MIPRSEPPAGGLPEGRPVLDRAPLAAAVGRIVAISGRLSRIQLAALGTGAAALVLYVRTLLPGVSFGDWAEMQWVPAQFGVLHPTGYPLYMAVGKLVSLFPIGSFALRANLLSAVAEAAAVGTAVLIAGRLGVRPAIAAILGLALAVTATVWQEATVAEVNALHLLLVAAVVHRALVWRAERRDRDLLIGAFLAGLALSNHLLAATAVPIVIAFVLADGWRRLVKQPVLVVQGALLFAAGLSFYVLIVLRALAGPPQLYARLATWNGFWDLVRGAQFGRDMHFGTGESVAVAWRAIPDVLARIQAGSSLVFLVAGLLGAAVLVRRDRWAGAIAILLAAANVYFFVNYRGDLYHYLLLTWFLLAVWAAVAMEAILGELERRFGNGLWRATVLLILLPIGIGAGQWPTHDHSQDQAGETFAAEVFDLLPENAILVSYWDALATLGYQHCVEGVRPDLTLRTYDTASRITCDVVRDPLEGFVRAGRPAYALFAIPSELDPLRRSFVLTPGPTLDLPYGDTDADRSGVLYELTLKAQSGG